ncbi:hypothetical protein SEPCBS119000_002539 [Sporothrix epigloea]|uniref:Uncharacterized protein n=1 Tax=Sporothrix epigloea TaxID=1892477 RepID=A0ABP0DGQ0_9PEZI
MGSFSSRRAAVAVLVAAAAATVFRYPLASLAGHLVIDKAGKLQQWADSAPLNNGACVVDATANACEDVVVHAPSGTVFAACGDPRARTQWFPPAGQRNARGRAALAGFREQLFQHDLATGKTTELLLEGVDGDFVTHGIDIWSSPTDPSLVHIFAVRHTRSGDSVSIFAHTLGTHTATLVADVKHGNIKTANGVAAVGPFAFYVTNDHYFFFDPWRKLEEMFGPWSWATNVQYCDAAAGRVHCKTVAGPYPAANGIAAWNDRLFVGDSQNGTLRVFQRRPDHTVDFVSQVELGAAADNIKVDPSTGDIVVAIFPAVENLPEYLANVEKLGKELRVSAGTLRLRAATGYSDPELLYFDDGGVLSDMTAMAIDPKHNVLIGAAVLQYGGFAVCKIGHTAAA